MCTVSYSNVCYILLPLAVDHSVVVTAAQPVERSERYLKMARFILARSVQVHQRFSVRGTHRAKGASTLVPSVISFYRLSS